MYLTHKKHYWIIQQKCPGQFLHRISSDILYQKNGTYGWEEKELRPSTPREIAHLQACIKAKKYVSSPKYLDCEIY